VLTKPVIIGFFKREFRRFLSDRGITLEVQKTAFNAKDNVINKGEDTWLNVKSVNNTRRLLRLKIY